MTETDIDWTNVEEAAKVCAGNHQKFECFSWSGEPPDSERYMIYNYKTRDSGLIEESNAHVIEETMLKFKAETVWTERHNHWAVGWVEAMVIKVYFKSGKITKAFRKFCELMDRIKDYPLLDEEDHSNREYEATIENIKTEGNNLVAAWAPDDWAQKVFSWLWDNDQGELESSDDHGAYPKEAAIKEALMALELIDPANDDRFLIEDFNPGDKVYVRGPLDPTCFWKKAFSGTVVGKDEMDGKLFVADCSGDLFEVYQGEFESEGACGSEDLFPTDQG